MKRQRSIEEFFERKKQRVDRNDINGDDVIGMNDINEDVLKVICQNSKNWVECVKILLLVSKTFHQSITLIIQEDCCDFKYHHNFILSKCINIQELNLECNKKITNDGIKNLTHLTNLNLYWNKKITNDGIVHLTHLTHLNLYRNKKITNEGIMHLTTLTSLCLKCSYNITNDGIMNLTNLTNLG